MTMLYLVEMTVSDLNRSLAWYTIWFDLEPALIDREHAFALFEPQGVRVTLKQGTPVVGSTLLTFEVANLEAALYRLKSHGIQPEGDIKVSHEGYHRARFRDPDGHAVSLFAWLE